MRTRWMTTVWILAVAASGQAAQQLTYLDLVKRLTDLEGLAALPQPGEKCAQWSSYDRASRYEASTNQYVGWDANGDNAGHIRTEGDKLVLAEMDGPGCIWRVWSAAPRDGRVMIYLDGASEPAVDLPFLGFFDRKNAPFTYPALVHNASSGQNCYVPIPYQKSCKILAEKNWGDYYHFTYQTYPKGTILPTFKRDLTSQESAALEAADHFLSSRLGADPAASRKGEVTEVKKLNITPGGAAVVAREKGPRALTSLRVKTDPSSIDDPIAAFREVVLRITWDQERSASVCVPLGDFFGTAPGLNKYQSLPLGMTDESFYSFWYMPFASSALVELVNEGKQSFKVEMTLTHAPLSRPIKDLGRFHVKWHRDAFLPEEPERKIDWTMLKTEGRGRFCGVMLHVWNPRGSWWGEGDEKFFVDGEKFPSTIGTGSEDYFGYAWCNPTLFQNAYHNETRSDNNAGHTSVNRWHITDNVPFHTSFEGAIEKYFPNNRPTLYACTAYWYLAPGGKDLYTPAPVEERTGYYVQPQVLKIPGAMEGEAMKILERTGGETQTQELSGFGPDWSGDAHLWWTGGKPGDKLVLAIPVKEAGRYDLKAQFTKAIDYGIVQFLVDGQKLGSPLDLFNNGVIATGPIFLGTVELASGEHQLTVEITGANEKAVKGYMFGLDYLKLEAAK